MVFSFLLRFDRSGVRTIDTSAQLISEGIGRAAAVTAAAEKNPGRLQCERATLSKAGKRSARTVACHRLGTAGRGKRGGGEPRPRANNGRVTLALLNQYRGRERALDGVTGIAQIGIGRE